MPDTPPASSEKIVVLIDDETAYVDLLTQMLQEQFGLSVLGFTRPTEALRALPTLNAGIVITDYQMPEMNGIKLCTELYKLAPEIPVLMVTGNTTRLSERETTEIPSLRAIVSKPFKWPALSAEIIRHWSGGPIAKAEALATPANHL